MDIIQGKTPGPWSLLIYGPPGVGKSSLAATAPRPFFIDLEDGLSRVDCSRSPALRDWAAVHTALLWVYESDFQTVVIDTLDALEQVLTVKLLEAHRKTSLADFGYGKGYEMLEQEWAAVLKILAIIKAKGKNILLLGHEQILKFEDPTSENYDRYTIKIHKKSAAMVVAKLDGVLFAKHEMFVKDKADGQKKMGVGTGQRVLHTLDTPAFTAKNRFDLPAEIPMDSELWARLL